MKQLIPVFFLFPFFASAQIVWQENFDAYIDGTTVGDNANVSNTASDWQTSCPTCANASDYLAVQSGLLECRDPNGPATWTSELIDLSSYPGPFSFSMDFTETGSLEGCDPGCGVSCVDWIRLEVSLDGGAFVSLTSPNGGTCNNVAAGGDFLLIGEFGSYSYQAACFTASSIQLRVSFQNWASSEYMSMDNVVIAQDTVLCTALDLKSLAFEADYQDQNHLLSWDIEMENEELESICLEQSVDGSTFVPLQYFDGQQLKYQFLQDQPLPSYTYYRLNLKRENGGSYYSNIKALNGPNKSADFSLGPNPLAAGQELQLFSQLPIQELKLYNSLGQILLIEKDKKSIQIPKSCPAGSYILQIKAAGLMYYRKIEVL
ncbi:hypothetical protein SapgrDRAFT_1749 [Saprospira grandis DSM 2844]|uniref:Secretion system C-terminal sorting domain-containing protein n=1 Tax=Saprospira grandis DSM 2844 TaxID=694433 RepID=J1I512_9BACT|nr:T9SS type A sorting domain-containing protein [Saprospira grandis]EJF53453.1 hypothetical protein SapgrDRAFT_1749 [Saprospira grandis DSM 2844]